MSLTGVCLCMCAEACGGLQAHALQYVPLFSSAPSFHSHAVSPPLCSCRLCFVSSGSSVVPDVDFKGLKDDEGRPLTYRQMTIKDDFKLPWLNEVSANHCEPKYPPRRTPFPRSTPHSTASHPHPAIVC